VIEFPSKRWGYVGTIPTVLGTQVRASTAAVMGLRAFTNEAGEIVEWKFPTFATEAEAREFAAAKGCEVRS